MLGNLRSGCNSGERMNRQYNKECKGWVYEAVYGAVPGFKLGDSSMEQQMKEAIQQEVLKQLGDIGGEVPPQQSAAEKKQERELKALKRLQELDLQQKKIASEKARLEQRLSSKNTRRDKE